MPKEIATAMLGGTFDPIHKGHLFLLDSAIKKTEFKRFIIVPAFVSNFKQNAGPSASDSQRLDMVKLALEDFSEMYKIPADISIEISDIELKRKGVSYTYDTVVSLKKDLDLSGKLGLLMGDDHVKSLTKWYRYNDLKNEVKFIICRREKDSCWNDLPVDADCVLVVPDSLSPESSTEVRNNLASSKDFLSQRVYDYVKRNGLYV